MAGPTASPSVPSSRRAPGAPTARSAAVAPGPHGGDGPKLAARLGVHPSEILDLSQSLNPAAPDPAPVLARHLDAVHHYPDPALAERGLAETMGVDGERLVLTN